MYIHPENEAIEEPLLDELTKKILWATRNKTGKGVLMNDGSFIKNANTRGTHQCTGCNQRCAVSVTYDIILSNNLITNSLAVHYTALHRDELSESDLAKIEKIEIKCDKECLCDQNNINFF